MFKKQLVFKFLFLVLVATFYQTNATNVASSVDVTTSAQSIFVSPDPDLIKFCRAEFEKSIANSSKQMFNDSFVSGQERQELLKQAEAEVKSEAQERAVQVRQLFEHKVGQLATRNYTAILNDFNLSGRKCTQSTSSNGQVTEQVSGESKKSVSNLVLDDLKVFSGNKTSGLFNVTQRLFGKNGLAPVSTPAGFAAAAYALANPETNKEKLEKRRAELLRLVANPELVGQLREQLNAYATARSGSFDQMLSPILPEPFDQKKHVNRYLYRKNVISKIVDFREYLNLDKETEAQLLEKDLTVADLMQLENDEFFRKRREIEKKEFRKKLLAVKNTSMGSVFKFLSWYLGLGDKLFNSFSNLLNIALEYVYSTLSLCLPFVQIKILFPFIASVVFQALKTVKKISLVFPKLALTLFPLYCTWMVLSGFAGIWSMVSHAKMLCGFLIRLVCMIVTGEIFASCYQGFSSLARVILGVLGGWLFDLKIQHKLFILIIMLSSMFLIIRQGVLSYPINKNRLSAVGQLLVILDNLQSMIKSGQSCEKMFSGQSTMFDKSLENKELDFNKKIKQLTSRKDHKLTYLPKYRHGETISLFKEFFKNLSVDSNGKIVLPDSKVVLDGFTPMHERIGEIDLLVSLAELVIKSKGQRAEFAVVDFIHGSDRAIVDGKDLWNTLINREVVVPNDVEIGLALENGKFVQGQMVTAGNGCGKSVHILAVATAVYLAQCLGVAPAKSLTITPFDRFVTQINTVDDPLNNKSLFRAQIRQFGQMVTEITNGSEFGQKLTFVCLDESLSGTKPKYAGPLLAALIKGRLSTSKNFAMLFATHLEHLASGIEKLSDGAVVPVKVKCNLDSEGHFESSTFEINPGPSSIDSAFKVAQEEWVDFMPEQEVADLIVLSKQLFGNV